MHVPQGHLWLACKLVSNPDAIEILKNLIDLYHAIGIKNMVLHMEGGISGLSRDEVIGKNVEKLREIAEADCRSLSQYINLVLKKHIEKLQ